MPMNIWARLDAMKERFEADLRAAIDKAHVLGAYGVRVDDFGRWVCSWRPTRGERRAQRITARTSRELLRRIKKARLEQPPKRRPGRKPKQQEGDSNGR